MNIIFCDIDGVLVPLKNRNDLFGFYPYCVDALNELTKKGNCEIVITSNWRYSMSTKDLAQKFAFSGVMKNPIGVTPMGKKGPGVLGVYQAKGRQEEIYQWLGEHPDVNNYVILDDESAEITSARLVLVNGLYGLRFDDVEKALGILGVKG
jgi:hypothetical protein